MKPAMPSAVYSSWMPVADAHGDDPPAGGLAVPAGGPAVPLPGLAGLAGPDGLVLADGPGDPPALALAGQLVGGVPGRAGGVGLGCPRLCLSAFQAARRWLYFCSAAWYFRWAAAACSHFWTPCRMLATIRSAWARLDAVIVLMTCWRSSVVTCPIGMPV